MKRIKDKFWTGYRDDMLPNIRGKYSLIREMKIKKSVFNSTREMPMGTSQTFKDYEMINPHLSRIEGGIITNLWVPMVLLLFSLFSPIINLKSFTNHG